MTPTVELPESPHFPGGGINRYLENAVAIVPSDTVDYIPPTTVYVGKSGDVTIVPGGGRFRSRSQTCSRGQWCHARRRR